MRRSLKVEATLSLGRRRSLQALLVAFLLYVALFFVFELPFFSRGIRSALSSSGHAAAGIPGRDSLCLPLNLGEVDLASPHRPSHRTCRLGGSAGISLRSERRRVMSVAGLDFLFNVSAAGSGPFSGLHKAWRDAWEAGQKLLKELKAAPFAGPMDTKTENRSQAKCPHSIILSGEEFLQREEVMLLPCGLTLGSHITLVGKPYQTHAEYHPKITILNEGEKEIMVSQFMMKLQGLKTVDGERILHFNPRLKGDWSGKPVIE